MCITHRLYISINIALGRCINRMYFCRFKRHIVISLPFCDSLSLFPCFCPLDDLVYYTNRNAILFPPSNHTLSLQSLLYIPTTAICKNRILYVRMLYIICVIILFTYHFHINRCCIYFLI